MMRYAFRGAVLAFLGLLAGCVPAAVQDPDSIPTRTLVEVRNDRVAGLTPETGYASKAITAAMPGYTVETITAAVESKTVAAYGVFFDGIQVLQVHRGSGGKIGSVHGVTHHLVGPNGERIGQTFGDLRIARSSCKVGRNLWRGMALCRARGAGNVTLVFAIPQYQGPFDRLAPEPELRGAVLQRIVWSAA